MSSKTLGEIAALFNLTLEGEPDCIVSGVAPLNRAKGGELTFLSNRKFGKHLDSARASAVLLPSGISTNYSGNRLYSDNPHADFARITALFHPSPKSTGKVHPTASVHSTAQLGVNVEVGANCYLGKGVSVGADSIIGTNTVLEDGVTLGTGCRLYAGTVVYNRVRIGDRVIVHSGAVIGADGFGLAKDGETWLKVPQVGGVVIGDDVEIGANTTIDRGAMDDTVVGSGVKLDNQIQIAHNVVVGANTAIAACVGIAGSAIIGERCTIGGAAVILGHLEVTDDVHITAMSLVTKSIKDPGTYSSGTPLQDNALWHRNFVRFKQLDEMAKKIARLERTLDSTK